jgi:hypothetical protein
MWQKEDRKIQIEIQSKLQSTKNDTRQNNGSGLQTICSWVSKQARHIFIMSKIVKINKNKITLERLKKPKENGQKQLK